MYLQHSSAENISNDICSAHIGPSEHSLCFEIVKLGSYHIWPVSNSFVVISYLLLTSLEKHARNFVDDPGSPTDFRARSSNEVSRR